MASFALSNLTCYVGGYPDSDQKRFGKQSGEKVVLACPFTTSDTGASYFSFRFTLIYDYRWNNVNPSGYYNFKITENTDSNIASYKEYQGEGDGAVVFEDDPSTETSNYYIISGKVNRYLKPNTSYILWFFPSTKNTYNNLAIDIKYNNKATYTYELGPGGVVKIYTNDGWANAIPWIYTMDTATTGSWKRAIPWIYSNGWKNTC